MEPGLTTPVMDMSGNPMSAASGLTARMVTGFGLTSTNGYGYQIMTGAGDPSITDAGTRIHSMDGSGFRDMIGLLHGYLGDQGEIIMDGHR